MKDLTKMNKTFSHRCFFENNSDEIWNVFVGIGIHRHSKFLPIVFDLYYIPMIDDVVDQSNWNVYSIRSTAMTNVVYYLRNIDIGLFSNARENFTLKGTHFCCGIISTHFPDNCGVENNHCQQWNDEIEN